MLALIIVICIYKYEYLTMISRIYLGYDWLMSSSRFVRAASSAHTNRTSGRKILRLVLDKERRRQDISQMKVAQPLSTKY